MTIIALLTHPANGHDHPIKLTAFQEEALQSTLRLLDKIVHGNGRRVAVLASPALAAANYARLVADHFRVDLPRCECEGLLRHRSVRDMQDTCDCIEDFFDPTYGLTVAVVSREIGKNLAILLSKHIKRQYEEILAPKAHAYVI